jgi:hypothetical protein
MAAARSRSDARTVLLVTALSGGVMACGTAQPAAQRPAKQSTAEATRAPTVEDCPPASPDYGGISYDQAECLGQLDRPGDGFDTD